MLSEAHRQSLQLKYGLPEPVVMALEEAGEISSLQPSEVHEFLGRQDFDSTGMLIKYPGNGAATVRLDNPPVNDKGRPQKYLRPKGAINALYIPSGLDLKQVKEIWVTEGELKAIAGYARGLPVIALSGIYNWRTSNPDIELPDGEKLTDKEALLPGITQIDWSDKGVILLFDSDIIKKPEALPAFDRLAEQLYRLKALWVKICILPSLPEVEGKTGLDDYIKAKGPEQALQDLQAIRDRAEPYLPIKAGGPTYAERLIKSSDPKDKQKAAIAILGAEGEFFAVDWLNKHGLLKKDSSLLIKEAKARLKELQAKPRASPQAEPSQDLGSEYAHVNALLAVTKEYCLDRVGDLYKKEEKYNRETGKKEIELTNICNFVPWPIREIIKDSGSGTPEKYLELQGLLQGGHALKPEKILLSDFLDKAYWAGQLWGAKVAIRPYFEKEVRYAVQLMAKASDIPRTTIYTHLGWRKIGDKWVYLHAAGCIGSEGIEVEINPRLGRYSFPSEVKDIAKAVGASLSILDLAPKKLTYPSLGFTYLAPLMEPLRQAGIEPGFLLYIRGITGSLKSSWLALLLNHYGATFDNKSLPASFRDTTNSIEGLAFLAKDCLLVVDDLYPSADPNERRRQSGILDTLSRSQGDRRARGRMKADTTLREGLPPRGLALGSGEIMALKGSSQPRGLIERIQKGDIDSNKLTIAQDQKALLSEAMRGYIEYLAPQIGQLPPHLSEDFHNLRVQAQKDSKVRTRHPRLNEIVAHLYLGLNFFIEFAISTGAITQKEGETKLLEAWAIFNEVVDDQAKLAAGEEPVKRFFESIKELEAQGRVFFAAMEDETPKLANSTQGARKIGWGPDESGIYYLLYGPALEAVAQYLRTQEESLPLSKSDLLDAFEQKGLLALRQGDRRSIKKTIVGTDFRVLPISEKAFSLGDDDYV